jgi:hypothetical protein
MRGWAAILSWCIVAGALPLSAQDEYAKRACRLGSTVSEADLDQVEQCAEEFVRGNGYTAEPPLPDTLLLALEAFEEDVSWSVRLARRRGTLSPAAVASYCVGQQCTVIFEFADLVTDQCWGRAVTMTQAYDWMEVRHQNILHIRCRGARF